MGVLPPGVGLQGLTSNHPILLWPKAVVVSEREKAVMSRQVSDEKVSASEPLLTQPLRGSPRATKWIPEAVNMAIMSLKTNALAWGGAVRHRDEAAVMTLERRNCVIQSVKSDQPEFLGGIR